MPIADSEFIASLQTPSIGNGAADPFRYFRPKFGTVDRFGWWQGWEGMKLAKEWIQEDGTNGKKSLGNHMINKERHNSYNHQVNMEKHPLDQFDMD